MAFLRKKKEPVEVELEEVNNSKTNVVEENQSGPKVLQQLVPIEFALAEQHAQLEEKIDVLTKKVDELLKVANE